MNRKEIAEIIIKKLNNHENDIKNLIKSSKNRVGYFYIDDLLPKEQALKLFSVFPATKDMVLKKSMKEYKYVGAQMNLYDNLLEETLYAFQNDKIVNFMTNMFQLKSVYPDPNLYAGGLSAMSKNHFLNPHIDNSHDKDRKKWRVLNLLYYITPNWKLSYGGNLEIWHNGLKNNPTTIHCKFNRLVVMLTHNESWHSVSPIKFEGRRCCISNYYFSDFPIDDKNKFHVTSFRARPRQQRYELIFKFDNYIRMLVRKIFKYGLIKPKHLYDLKNKNRKG